jgi:uncharacterized circularly permuted ATP-grasp superfamily protein/uncharacterized alpha-E superfamily protein
MASSADNPTQGLFSSYRALEGRFDELVDADGGTRGHWPGFLESMAALGDEARASAVETAARLLRQNDLSYLTRGAARPWKLDVLPLLIPGAQWQALEAGLVQRARLLNALVADLYGPQNLLKTGALPPALGFATEQFLPAAHGVTAKDDVYLHLVAFDLGRSPDGQWWVIGNRAQAPAGAGHALENRIVVSRSLPAQFTDGNVQRIAGFFGAFGENLRRFGNLDEHLAVVLSPGPGEHNYFEQAFLGRYMGYPVVEGADLTVRGGRIYLKTLEGLKPVDLIIRRLDSALCDPLELKADSTQGVAGLMQAARQGRVVMANALGSGVIENSAINSFLPGLSLQMLGEELKLPSLASWWCGQPREREHVINHLETLNVRRAFERRSMLAGGPLAMLEAEFAELDRGELVARINQQPHQFIAQESLSLGTAPCLLDGQNVTAEPCVIRVFLAATESGYRLMPGGLVLVDGQQGELFAKDLWVLSEGAVDTTSLVGRSLQSPTLVRVSGEGTPEGSPVSNPIALSHITGLLVSQGHLSVHRGRRASAEGVRAVEQEVRNVLFDPESPDGLANVLANVRRTAGLVRERLSPDTRRILEQLSDTPRLRWRAHGLSDALRMMNELIEQLSAANGMILENMTRGYGWRLLDLGRRIERARTTARLVRGLAVHEDAEVTGVLNLLLELLDSAMTYPSRYRSAPTLPATLDLVLADDSNPRSVVFQFAEMSAHMDVMPLEEPLGPVTEAQRIVVGLHTDLKLLDVEKLGTTRTKSGALGHLDRLMRRVVVSVDDLSRIVAGVYFSHSLERRVTGVIHRDGDPRQ